MTADGNEMPNLGEVYVTFLTREGTKCGIKFQVADVRRPLLAVSSISSKGNLVEFAQHGGTIKSLDGKMRIDFEGKDRVYTMDLYVHLIRGRACSESRHHRFA